MDATHALISTRGAGGERPPRLAFRFVLYTGLVLLVVGVSVLWVLQRDVTTRVETRVEQQAQQVAEATLRGHLRRADFSRPVDGARQRTLDGVFRDEAFLAGIVEATLYDSTGRVTYSTNHELRGRQPVGAEVAAALRGARQRSNDTIDRGGESVKVIRTLVPVRPQGAAQPMGALALAQDYRSLGVQIDEALQHTAVILLVALLVLWASLIPILRRTTSQLHARNRQLREQATDLERALAERNEAKVDALKLAAIVEGSHDAIIGADLAGHIVSWNRGAERLYGYTAEEMIGRSASVMIPPERTPEFEEHLVKIHHGVSVEHRETVRLRKDGSPVEVSLTLSPIHDADGVVVGIAAIARDITHVRHQQQQLEALLAKERVARAALAEQNDRLRELDRLKDEFISLVSHELRTPLTSIHGYLELLLDGGAGDLAPEQERFLTVVERNSKRLMQLVGDLLFMAQVEAGKLALEFDELDLAEVVTECVEHAHPIADDRGVELVASVPETASVVGDRSRISQVLDNLISNALKFTPRGGSVTVTVGRDGAAAVIEVADTGVGIPSGEQDRLFERFFRSSTATEQAIPGTGLGLTIAKTIVERHEGSISIESAEGDGTTVRVQLPVKTTVAEEVAA